MPKKGLIDKIEELQNRPPEARRRIFALSVFFTMTAITLVWGSTLKYTLKWREDDRPSPSPFAMIASEAANAASAIKSVAGEQWNKISAGITTDAPLTANNVELIELPMNAATTSGAHEASFAAPSADIHQ